MHHAEKFACKKGKRLVIAIDEFSDLPKYDGQTLFKGIPDDLWDWPFILHQGLS
jgi:hypothetical protein